MALFIVGCGAPPSTKKLMRVSQEAMRQEIEHIERASQREDRVLDQRQAALKVGYEADLQQRDKLTKNWVKQATLGYVTARESLLESHYQHQHRQRQRIDNLQAALHAQQRAITLLKRQDQLIERTLGGDLWQWQQLLNTPDSSEP